LYISSLTAVSGMSLDEIELKLRDEAIYGRSPHERAAQIPWIKKTLRQSLKNCITCWTRHT
jgi:hypothetical protein